MPMPLEIIGLGKREVRFVWEEGVEDVWPARALRGREHLDERRVRHRVGPERAHRPPLAPRGLEAVQLNEHDAAL